MVYFPNNKHRTSSQRLLRKVIGIVSVALIVFLLWNIPYDVLREERYRLYGETRTSGIVTGVRTESAADGGRDYFIEYKYIDNDGFARVSDAPLPKSIWDKFQTGSRVEILYVSGRPGLARIHGEIEPGFQVWLRNLLK